MGCDLPQEMENDTMENKKMTKMQKFEMLSNLPEVKNNPILAEFVAHEMELLSKKNSAEKKPTAQQTANAEIQQAVLNAMEPNVLYTITVQAGAQPAREHDQSANGGPGAPADSRAYRAHRGKAQGLLPQGGGLIPKGRRNPPHFPEKSS